jgi:hypothetical protein
VALTDAPAALTLGLGIYDGSAPEPLHAVTTDLGAGGDHLHVSGGSVTQHLTVEAGAGDDVLHRRRRP